uniref:Uncharacterized protein n=1 Tax=Corethrella appendiculata TaxID=1370023 RepID=U5EM22_9DIPT
MLKRKWIDQQKQFCAEEEYCDAFYARSEMESTKKGFQVPKIEQHYRYSENDLDIIDDIELPVHRLTGDVRQQYLKYLEKVLQKNYEQWMETADNCVIYTPNDVENCAKIIEMKAAQSSMIVSLYRRFVVKIIHEIKKETNDTILNRNFMEVPYEKVAENKKQTKTIGTQTESWTKKRKISQQQENEFNTPSPLPTTPQSLEDKIKLFERKFNLNTSFEFENRKSDKKAINSPTSSTTPTPFMTPASTVTTPSINNSIILKQNDKIEAELAEMFHSENGNNIFDECENQIQINAIIGEIEKFDGNTSKNTMKLIDDKSLSNSPQNLELFGANSESIAKSATLSSNSIENQLKKSIWPCELHMQTLKLRETLINIADKNILQYEKIKRKFIDLFGENDDESCYDNVDELGPYSPSDELNEIILASCRHRIAKWVVNGLMQPLNDGLIANRFLFKKLAKHIAESIIFIDQYPNEKFIKKFIVDYFCNHTMIQSSDDIT